MKSVCAASPNRSVDQRCLKDDGTSFSCVGLQGGIESVGRSSLAEEFGFSEKQVSVVSAKLASANIPESLVHWMVNRIRPASQADEEPLDERLMYGLCEEVLDIFGKAPQWFEIRVTPGSEGSHRLGAIWDIYVFGEGENLFAIHCSWDD